MITEEQLLAAEKKAIAQMLDRADDIEVVHKVFCVLNRYENKKEKEARKKRYRHEDPEAVQPLTGSAQTKKHAGTGSHTGTA